MVSVNECGTVGVIVHSVWMYEPSSVMRDSVCVAALCGSDFYFKRTSDSLSHCFYTRLWQMNAGERRSVRT